MSARRIHMDHFTTVEVRCDTCHRVTHSDCRTLEGARSWAATAGWASWPKGSHRVDQCWECRRVSTTAQERATTPLGGSQ